MFYDKKIKYFNYMENDLRLGCGGFVKLEARDHQCNIQIQISGLLIAENTTRKVYIISEDKKELLCEIALHQGKGNIALSTKTDDVCGGITYPQILSIQIPLSQERELVCSIAGKTGKPEPALPQTQIGKPEPTLEQVKIQNSEKSENEAKPNIEPNTENKARNNPTSEVNLNPENEAQCKIENSVIAPHMPMAESKWNQLVAIYPQIAPFQDDREYLSVGPGDFVILQQKYYQLVNNSFLLHGYYNYKHLILTRIKMREEVRYYIGVPGNFYEREKQVALMFGFESFECREEPASAGDFGYYMIRVEI